MKKIKYFLLIVTFVFTINDCFAFKYCDDDKTIFYDAFIEGYLSEMQKSIDNLKIDSSKKSQFMYLVRKNLDKDFLIKSSWNCIQTYPLQQIIPASVICTTEWRKKQNQNNSDLFDLLNH